LEHAVAEPFLSEIRLMSFGYPPQGWALCNGQLMQIAQNQALFSLLGTTFGGDGRVNFGLPDLRSRVPVHVGQGLNLGQAGGQQAVTLNGSQIPQHIHAVQAIKANSDVALMQGNLLASVAGLYGQATSLTTLDPSTVSNVGGSQQHQNMQPFLTLSFCIALQGIFPSPD
jgi:microcystin-dependent protein